jgi:O-methyltransferase involved in polyketide biosynthesis
MDKIEPKQLTGVSETALWTLWNRGSEALRPDRTVDDPLAGELLERIDYPHQAFCGAFVVLAFETASQSGRQWRMALVGWA